MVENLIVENLRETFVTLSENVEGVKDFDLVLKQIEIEFKEIIKSEVVILVINSRFELVFIYREMKVVLRTIGASVVNPLFINELLELNFHKTSIELEMKALIKIKLEKEIIIF